jgi:hypothetical protein
MGRAAACEQGTADREIRVMGTHKRRERRFHVESLETRWTPGGSPGGVQEWLGHRNIQHTMRYTALGPGRFKKIRMW